MNDFQEIRRLSLEWWRNLSEERQRELVKTLYPKFDFIYISTSSSMIQRMYEVLHQSSKKMDEKYDVRCNKCEWEGYENDLVLCEDEGGFFNGCPNCKKDDYLMDIKSV